MKYYKLFKDKVTVRVAVLKMISFTIVILLCICWSIKGHNITKNYNEKAIIPNVAVIDSDYLYIEKRSSLLPIKNAGIGVFAKLNIKNNTIICEYRGPIISEEYYSNFYHNDKLFDIKNINGKEHKIIGNNICAYINDCTSALNRSYTIQAIEMLNNGSIKMNCFDNYSYNAKYVKTFEGKVFVKSINDINKDEEIFFSYGW
jgi:hypothetical protein